MIWPATIVPEGQGEEFEKFCLDNWHVRVKFIEVIKTGPDYKNHHPVEGTGGRSDVFFYIHNDDIDKFAVQRFGMGDGCPRWLEDVLDNERSGRANGRRSLYPIRVKEWRKW